MATTYSHSASTHNCISERVKRKPNFRMGPRIWRNCQFNGNASNQDRSKLYPNQIGTTMNSVRQGETFTFTTGLTDVEASKLTNVFNVMQYPGDTPAITGTITSNKRILTSAETAALAIGQWFIYRRSSDTEDDTREPVKLYISKGWT